MKTERRHELQTNTLANSLGEGIEKVRPFTNHILLGIGAFILLLLAVMFFRSQAHAKQAQAWEAYFAATTPSETSSESEQDKLRSVIKDFGDTDMADWAKLTVGDEGLNAASQLIATNKSEARKNINAAIGEYKPLGESSRVPQVRNLANYNLGLCHELLGDIDNAVKAYSKVNGTMGKMAKARVEALEKNTEVRDFYAWFKDVEPATQSITGGNKPGQTPEFKVDDPDKVAPFSDVPEGKEGDGDNSPIKLFPEDANKTENPGDVKLPGLGVESPATTPAAPEGTTPEGTTPEAATPEEKSATPETGEAPAEKPAETPAPAEEAKPEGEAAPAAEEKPAEAAPAEAAPPEAPAKEEAAPAPAKSE